MIPHRQALSGSEPGQVEAIEQLLNLLPVAVARWDLPGGIAADAPAEMLCEALRSRGRLGYANAAHTRNAGTGEGAVAAAQPPCCMPDLSALRRFIADGHRMERVTVRLPAGDQPPRFCQATWQGVLEGDRLLAIWTILEDVTAARTLERVATARRGEPGDAIIGHSPGMQRVLEKIQQVAGTDSTVLIRGETGTGKELIASAIHQQSLRRDRLLIAVNCGAIASGLVESELFGHEKGAFTGAIARKQGRFELADGGTLFLDEIGDLSTELQVKLLRVLQEGELTRVGGAESIRVDVRIIAATHRDLAAMVRSGEFRQDLYYRLNVFPVLVPPLRERREDIPLLVEHFTRMYAARLGKRIDSIPQVILDQLSQFTWPGNIRELANVIERSVIVSSGPTLQLAEWATGAHMPVTGATHSTAVPAGLLDVEKRHILATLERTRWKVSGAGGAAEVLGLKPTTLEARMKKLGISRPGV
jgi:transcriptional regulator with GAF, ATPase, and Fis domain